VLSAQPEPVKGLRQSELNGKHKIYQHHLRCKPMRTAKVDQLIAIPRNDKETSYRN